MSRILNIGMAAALIGGIVVAFSDPLVAMIRQWNASPMYSYAYTVPLISLFLIWSRRDDFRRRRLTPARLLAFPVLGLSLAMLVLGHVGAIQIVQQLGLIVAIGGVVLFLFGVDYLAVSAPAIAYLLFMVPIWDVFTERLHWPFQHNSARMAVALMHAGGVPAYRDGTVIALPNVVIEVARACSGVNYLVAVLALALPLSFLRLQSAWRRVALVAGSMIVAAFANGLRVALIGVLAYFDVGSPLHGPFHVLHGLFVAGVGYIALFTGVRLLEWGDARPPSGTAHEMQHPSSWRLRDACGLAVAFWSVALIGAPQTTPVSLLRPLNLLPARLGEWQTDPIALHRGPGIVAPWDGADASLQRSYRTSEGASALVAIWYFEVQRQNREIVSSRVDELHRGAARRAVRLRNGGSFDANVVAWPERKRVGLFWYDLGGAAEAGAYAAKARSLWNVLRAGRSNAAVVMITTAAPAIDEGVLAPLDGLAADVHMALAAVWPTGVPIARPARTAVIAR